MEININSGAIESAASELETIKSEAQATMLAAHQAALNGSYSGVSGLDQLGSGHGTVLNGGPGSAMTVLESYAEQISWLHQALLASHSALSGQNNFVSRGMDIADEGGTVGADAVSFPQRPAPRFENFSFAPPVVAPALSIDQLAMDFSATKIGASTAAAAAWDTMSSGVSSVASGLAGIAGKLANENSGEVIDAATQKISEVAAAGETFSRNSAVMAESVRQLAKIKSQGNVQVSLARSALAAIADPVQKKAAEQAFLASFPASFTPSVVTGVPPIRNLMSMDGSVDGGGDVALGMNDVEGDGPAEMVDQVPGAVGVSGAALNALRTAAGAGNFSAVENGVGELATVGAHSADVGARSAGIAGTGTVDPLGTTSASLNSPRATAASLAPVGTSGAGMTPAVGGAVPGTAGAGLPLGPVGPAGGGFAAGNGATVGRAGFPGRGAGVTPATGGLPAAAPGRIGGVPGGAAMPTSGAAVPLTGTFGSGTGAGAGTGTSAGRSAGARGIAGAPGAGSAVSGMGTAGAGQRPAGPGSTTGIGGPGSGAAGDPGQPKSAAGAAGAGTKAGGTPVGRGMVPMMGAPMAGAAGGQQGKSSKVRTVTSSVEEDGNIAALLGERGPVVPGVIGAWARG